MFLTCPYSYVCQSGRDQETYQRALFPVHVSRYIWVYFAVRIQFYISFTFIYTTDLNKLNVFLLLKPIKDWAGNGFVVCLKTDTNLRK